ncbi:MAG: amidohydrolase family protein [Planctomycetes bacterium]|nr:amidohydrolase family protein [Planctomycetota bacterium]
MSRSSFASPNLAALSLAALLAAGLAAQAPAPAQTTAPTNNTGPVAFTHARLLPGGAPAIADGVLVVHNGKITALGGADTPIPEGAKVVDCRGKTITPGLIDASFRTAASLADANEQGSEVTPQLRALDTLDPEDKLLARARAAGVTAVHVMPGTRSVIGGLGCVVKTAGSEPRTMLLKEDASLRITMGAEPSMGNRAIRGGEVDSIYYRRPTTRMGVVWEVRRSFFDAKQALETTAGAPQPADPGTVVLQKVLQGQLTAVTTARSEQDLRTALRIADEFGYKTVLDEAQDAHLVLDEIQAAKTTVLLGAPSATLVAGTGAQDGAEPRSATVAMLAARGIPFVITTGTNLQALDLVREAMFATRNGLTQAQALDAVTLEPAKLLGIADRTGSLQKGKDADFVVWSTDPLDPAAVAESVHIDGISVLAPR